jgi:hypothetical protein
MKNRILDPISKGCQFSLILINLILCVSQARAQIEFIKEGQYPQYRTVSGLSGGGFGVLPDGRVNFKGAMALSTPIAYSLRQDNYVIVTASTSYDKNFRFIRDDLDINIEANGTFALLLGFTTPFGDITYTWSLLSGVLDGVTHLQWTPNKQKGPIRYAIGVQDLFGDGGSKADSIPGKDSLSRSLYAVVTTEFSPGLYASIGTGERRFRGHFVNLSYNINPKIKLLAEYEGAKYNYGIAFANTIKSGPNKSSSIQIYVGMFAGKYATWSIAINF